MSVAGKTGLYGHIACTDLPPDVWDVTGLENLPDAAASEAKQALLTHYKTLPQGWLIGCRPTPAASATLPDATQAPPSPDNDNDQDMGRGDPELPNPPEDGTGNSFGDNLLWWNTLQPHDMLASKRNARGYLPKRATAVYNNLRRRLLTLRQLPKHDPLHRAAWMAFSALEMLILAPAPDDSGTAADMESALHMVLRRLAVADLGQWHLLWKETITDAPGRRMSAAKEKARLAKWMQSLAEASEATRALQLPRNTGGSLTTADTVPKLKALFPKARLPLARRYIDLHDDGEDATQTQQPALAQNEHGQYPRTGNPTQHGGSDQ